MEVPQETLEELRNEHNEFVELLKQTNKKLDKLVEIMEETREKPTDISM